MRFRILVGGGNVLIRDESSSKTKVMNFVAARFVTALSGEEACQLAIEAARQELQFSILNEPSSPPIFRIEGVLELKDGDHDPGTRRGFTFYTEPKAE